jgi:hypothetical protein
LLLFIPPQLHNARLQRRGNVLGSNEGELCGTIFFPFFFLVLGTEDGVLVLFIFILLLERGD